MANYITISESFRVSQNSSSFYYFQSASSASLGHRPLISHSGASNNNSAASSMSGSKKPSPSKSEPAFVKTTKDDWFSEADEVAKASSSKNAAVLRQESSMSSIGSTSSSGGVALPSADSTSTTVSQAKPSRPGTRAKHPSVISGNDVSSLCLEDGKPESERSSTNIVPVQGRVLRDIPATKQDTEPEAIPVSKPIIYQKKNLLHSPTELKMSSGAGGKSDEWVIIGTNGEKVKEPIEEKIASEIMKLNNKIARIDKFKLLVEEPVVDLEKLRKLSWNGIPDEFRATTWQLLMGYLPSNSERRQQTLMKKRNEYNEYVRQSFSKGQAGLDHTIWHQIHIDVPRTNPSIKLYQHLRIQNSLEKILYCWAIRHPASGYVQGINDLCTPFFQVFLSYHLRRDEIDEHVDLDTVSEDILQFTEADTFWCLSKLLDGIQDNYTHGQPGILRQIQKMKELIGRIDAELFSHIQAQGIDFIQFAFRWMNCLLMRELSLQNVIRMWDTYLSEGPDGFSDFHVYVCGAFLAKWSDHLKKLDFQDMIIFLQSIPSKDWTEKEVEILLSEAYMWKSLFHNSPSHLVTSAGRAAQGWTI